MASPSDIRDARAELQKMQAEMADDKAFGMFSPALQRRITETKKALADLTVQVGRQKDAERELAKQRKISLDEEVKANRARLIAIGAMIAGYAKVRNALVGLRQAGLENSIEANRQQIAYTLLGREIAGIFLPATNAATNATMASANALSKLSEGGQNAAFIMATTTAGLVAFSTASMAASFAGMKFTGVLGGIMKWLPAIGLGGGLLVGLGTLFLNTKDGADLLNKALEKGVDLLNEMAKAADTLGGKFGNDGWFDKMSTKLAMWFARAGENAGLLPEGTVKAIWDDAQAAIAKNKGNNPPGKKPTPGNYQFEGVADAYERVQLAAAKHSLGKGIPEKHLATAEEQLRAQQQLNEFMMKNPFLSKPLAKIALGMDF